MSLLKFFLLSIFLSAFSHSDIIAPNLISQDDHLDPSLPQLIFSFSVDCTNSVGTFYVLDSNLTPISNVSSYLSYLDYSTPLLSRSVSDQNGKITHALVGKTIFMRGIFVWYFTKEGYRPKEVQFDIRKCFENKSISPSPIYSSSPTTPLPSTNPNQSVLMSEPKYWTNTTENPVSSATVNANNLCAPLFFLLFFISIGLKNN
jgi:hypothetical protein